MSFQKYFPLDGIWLFMERCLYIHKKNHFSFIILTSNAIARMSALTSNGIASISKLFQSYLNFSISKFVD